MCSPVRCWSAFGSGFSYSSWSHSEWQDLSSAKTKQKWILIKRQWGRVSLHVCRWHRLQQNIQFWIKHAVVMTQCFSQQGRNAALGEITWKEHGYNYSCICWTGFESSDTHPPFTSTSPLILSGIIWLFCCYSRAVHQYRLWQEGQQL